jgi:hypothetical protein
VGGAPVVINEVLYDPAGSDQGGEFVEIVNSAAAPVSLEGWRLESGNGAGPDRWTEEWVGPPGLVLDPGALYVIGEDLVEPPADTVVTLDLQNGPDGCRIVAPGGAADVVGWGEHELPEYYEGRPAPEPPAGSSLARRHDAVDTDDNAADFEPGSPPTPGARNRPHRDLGLEGEVGWAPRWGGPGEPIEVFVRLVNRGSEPWPDPTARVVLEPDSAAGSSGLLAWAAPPGALASDAAAEIALPWDDPPEGVHALRVRVDAAGDERSANDTLPVTVRSGIGPLYVSELLYRPETGGVEWIELANAGNVPFDAGGATLEDANGEPRSLVDGPLPVAPGERLVVTPDEAALHAAYAIPPDVTVIVPAGGWASLNNHDSADGRPADAVVLRLAGGTPLDSVAYRSAWGAETGQSLERVSAAIEGWREEAWIPSIDPSGATPGRPPALPAGPEGGFDGGVGWEVEDAPDGGLEVHFAFSGEVETAVLALYSAGGRRVATVWEGAVPDRGVEAAWSGVTPDGRPLAEGMYVLHLVGYDGSGDPRSEARRAWLRAPGVGR